jgi:putative intracellular protease/amidase
VQLVLVFGALWFAASQLAGQWSRFRPLAATLRPSWLGIAGSAVLVLATYALLIESWRTLVRAWGDRLAFGDAARIWTVSNLGRYVPGKIWSIGAMGALAQRAGVSPVAATGSAVVGTVVNLAAGLAVVFLAGADAVRTLFPQWGRWTAVLPVAGLVGLVVTPLLMPVAVRAIARLTAREAPAVRVPTRALVVLIGANVASWIGYGLAFEWLAGSLVPTAGGNHLAYVAVFAGSYLAGYLALVVPGGFGVRETFLIAGLTQLRLADAPTAALLAVASRLWLTILELAPGLLFLAAGAARPSHRPTSDAKA